MKRIVAVALLGCAWITGTFSQIIFSPGGGPARLATSSESRLFGTSVDKSMQDRWYLDFYNAKIDVITQPPGANESVFKLASTQERKHTSFADLEKYLTDVQDLDGIYTSGELKNLTQIFVFGQSIEVKGRINFFNFYKKSEGKLVTGINGYARGGSFPTRYGLIDTPGWVGFDLRGTLYFAWGISPRTFNIGGLEIKYEGVKTPYSGKIFFHKSGSISKIHIGGPTELTVYGRKLVFDHVEGCGADLLFYSNESFRGGALAKAANIDGIIFPKGTDIHFWPNGNIKQVWWSGSEYTGSITMMGYKAGGPEGGGFEFNKDGSLKTIIRSSESFVVDGKKVDAGDDVNIYPYKGKISFFPSKSKTHPYWMDDESEPELYEEWWKF